MAESNYWKRLRTIQSQMGDLNLNNPWRPRPSGYYDVLAIFQQAILSYSERQLTYDADLLNEFSVVLSIVTIVTESPVRFAVPERGMHRFLFWKPKRSEES
jgi:hypothetical protein